MLGIGRVQPLGCAGVAGVISEPGGRAGPQAELCLLAGPREISGVPSQENPRRPRLERPGGRGPPRGRDSGPCNVQACLGVGEGARGHRAHGRAVGRASSGEETQVRNYQEGGLDKIQARPDLSPRERA